MEQIAIYLLFFIWTNSLFSTTRWRQCAASGAGPQHEVHAHLYRFRAVWSARSRGMSPPAAGRYDALRYRAGSLTTLTTLRMPLMSPIWNSHSLRKFYKLYSWIILFGPSSPRIPDSYWWRMLLKYANGLNIFPVSWKSFNKMKIQD